MDIDISDVPHSIKSGAIDSNSAQVIMADGSVQKIPRNNLGRKLQEMARIADGK